MKSTYAFSLLTLVLLSIVAANQTSAQQKFSLVIGIDGLGSYGLMASDTPNIDSLINGTFGGDGYRGAFTPHAFAGGEFATDTEQQTSSGTGWSTFHTGVWTDWHGVTNNSFAGNNFSHPNPNLRTPSYLETLEVGVAGLYSASLTNWTPIDTHIIEAADNAVGIDHRTPDGSDLAIASAAANQIANLSSAIPAAVFVHFDEVDGAGHATGSFSQGYFNEVADTDDRVGTLLAAITSRPNFANEDWQIVVCSDHGHQDDADGDHGGQSAPERTIPFIVTSKSAMQGFIAAGGTPRSQADVAPTVLSHFSVAAPDNYYGVARGGSAVPIDSSSLQSGLVSHLSFDGDLQAGAAGSDGTEIGSVSYSTGRFGQAVQTAIYGDGSVQLSDDLAAQFGTDGDFSMSIWVKYDSFTGDPAFFSNKNWDSGQNTGINLAVQGSNTLDFNTKGASGSRRDIEPFSGLEAGVWQNVSFTFDRDGATNLYIDGTLAGQISSTTQGSLDGAFNFQLLNDGTGSYGTGSAVNLQIDEFAAWNRLLTNDEVTVLSQSTVALILGDMNCDGVVNLLDVSPFISLISDGIFNPKADMNQDGIVNLLDVADFVATLSGG